MSEPSSPIPPDAFVLDSAHDAERLTARDIRTLALWVLAGVLGAVIAFRYFFAAFPEAALDLRITRAQAEETAREFLTAQAQRVESYESTVVFVVDDGGDQGGGAKTYLEREVGLEQANRLMASEVSVWFWQVRFFRPLQQEEFRVDVAPTGRIVGMQHVVEEARAGASLDAGAARAAAESFLRERVKADLGAYDFLPEEANSTERPKRRDWSFSWERRGFKAKDATYRLRVALHGDAIGSYREYLKVPEAWQRDFQKLRSGNLFWQYVATVPYILFTGAALMSLFDFARRGRIAWGGLGKLGAVIFMLTLLTMLNQWPLTRAGYDTNSSYQAFFALQMGIAVLIGLGAFVTVVLPMAPGEVLYRSDHPAKMRMAAPFLPGLWRPALGSKEFFRACVIGLAMASAHIGFIVAFYLLGRNVGVWAPQDINYTDALSTTMPWLFPLAISLYAATSEEFLFRLFAIPLLLRLTRSKLAAVVVPALVWGFLHSAYPQQPGYIRGIEVGILGIVAGWVMLRWGILATLVWHYTVDAMLIGLFLLRSESLYFRVSGFVVGAMVLFPLLVSGGMFVVRRRFSADAALFNVAAPVPVGREEVAPVAARPAGGYRALSVQALGAVVVAGLLGFAYTFTVRPEVVGTFVRFSVDAREAGERADAALQLRKVDPARFRRVVTSIDTTNGLANEFLRREIGIAALNQLYQQKVPSVFWHARYFQDGKKEEYRVVLYSDGKLHAVHHALEEKTPGANLTKEEAQARAEAFLREEKKLDLTQWKLVDAKSEKQPGRTDHIFTWEEIAAIGSAGAAASSEGKEKARVRVELRVQGDEVAGYRIFVKIPEEWEREQTRFSLADIAYLAVRVLFGLVLVILVLVLFFRNLRVVRVPWARVSRWALWGALALVVSLANTTPKFLAQYATEVPYQTFLMILIIGQFLVLSTLYSGILLSLAFGWFFVSRAFGEERIPAWRAMPAAYYRDALCLAVGGAGVVAVLARLPLVADRFWPTLKDATPMYLPQTFDLLFPAVGEIAGVIVRGLGSVGGVALLAGFLAVISRTGLAKWQPATAPQGEADGAGLASPQPAPNRSLLVLFFVLFTFLLAGSGSSATDFAKHVVLTAATLAINWWAVVRLFRFNMLAYFLLAVVTGLTSAITTYLRQPNAFFRLNGWVAAAALAAFLLWPLLAWLRGAADTLSNQAAAGSTLPP